MVTKLWADLMSFFFILNLFLAHIRTKSTHIAKPTAGRGQFCSPAEFPAEVNVDACHSKYSRIIRIIAYDSAIFRMLCIYIHFCGDSAGRRIVPFQPWADLLFDSE
jgi:hypothetical protein